MCASRPRPLFEHRKADSVGHWERSGRAYGGNFLTSRRPDLRNGLKMFSDPGCCRGICKKPAKCCNRDTPGFPCAGSAQRVPRHYQRKGDGIGGDRRRGSGSDIVAALLDTGHRFFYLVDDSEPTSQQGFACLFVLDANPNRHDSSGRSVNTDRLSIRALQTRIESSAPHVPKAKQQPGVPSKFPQRQRWRFRFLRRCCRSAARTARRL